MMFSKVSKRKPEVKGRGVKGKLVGGFLKASVKRKQASIKRGRSLVEALLKLMYGCVARACRYSIKMND